MIRDLEITIAIRNNQLKERRLKIGFTQKQLAFAADIPLHIYAPLECLKRSPIIKGQWSEAARKLAMFYEVSENVLFPKAIKAIDKSKIVRFVDINVDALPEYPSCESEIDNKRFVERALSFTEGIRRDIVERSVMRGDALSEIGKDIHKSRERVRQLESSALRRIRGGIVKIQPKDRIR